MIIKITIPSRFSAGAKKFNVALAPRCKKNRFYDQARDICYFSTDTWNSFYLDLTGKQEEVKLVFKYSDSYLYDLIMEFARIQLSNFENKDFTFEFYKYDNVS